MSGEQSAATVHVVDDDPAVLRAVALLVRAVGLPVQTYASAKVFLETHVPGEAGCLVLDLQMPGMNGVELLEELTAAGSQLRTIIMTATPEHPRVRTARVLGAIAVLAKPPKAGELQRCIQRALDASYAQS